jgi:hypothetical protein
VPTDLLHAADAAMDGDRNATLPDERFRLVTPTQLEELTGRPAYRWTALARAGLVPHIKEGRRVSFRPLDVLAWIEGGGQGLKYGWRHAAPAPSAKPARPRRGPRRVIGAP